MFELMLLVAVVYLVVAHSTTRKRLVHLEKTVQQLHRAAEPAPLPVSQPVPTVAPPPVAPVSEWLPESEPMESVPLVEGLAPLPEAPAWLQALRQNPLWKINPIAKVGIAILLIGVVMLARYAIENEWFPLSVRLGALAAGGAGVLFGGWRLRGKNRLISQHMQGLGIATLYITAFAAAGTYRLIPMTAGLGFMVVVCAGAAVLAVLQGAQSQAVIGFLGGFAAPILLSTGSNKVVVLCGYYLVLNLGTLAIAAKQPWRLVAWIGALATFGVIGAWQLTRFDPSQSLAVDGFLLAFFVLYVAITVLLARQPVLAQKYPDGAAPLRNPLSGSLVFGLPLAVLPLHLGFIPEGPSEMALRGLSTLGFGLFYLVLARQLRHNPLLGLLRQAFAALGVIFASLAVPLAFDDSTTAGVWGIEAAGILWLGVMQQRGLVRLFSMLLLLGAITALWQDLGRLGETPMLNGFTWARLLVGAGSVFCAYIYHQHRAVVGVREVAAARVLLPIGAVCLISAGLIEAYDSLRPLAWSGVWMAALSAAALAVGSRWLWTACKCMGVLTLAGAATHILDMSHPFPWAAEVWFAWPSLWAVLAAVLWAQRRNPDYLPPAWTTAVHAFAVLHLSALLGYSAYAYAPWPLAHYSAPLVLALSLFVVSGSQPAWPLQAQPQAYVRIAGPIGAVLGVANLIWLNGVLPAHPEVRPYFIGANFQDVLSIALLIALYRWHLALGRTQDPHISYLPVWSRVDVRACRLAMLGLLAFLVATSSVLRAVHFYGDVAYADLGHSPLAHAVISGFWGSLGMLILLGAGRRGHRNLWLTGAALMAVVVIKLFAFDLEGRGTLLRVASFLGVGALLLISGYFSPIPPRAAERSRPDDAETAATTSSVNLQP